MNEYYGVIYMLYKNGTSTQFLLIQESVSKPEDSYRTIIFGDMWVNWFDTKEAAESYILEV